MAQSSPIPNIPTLLIELQSAAIEKNFDIIFMLEMTNISLSSTEPIIHVLNTTVILTATRYSRYCKI